MCEFIVKEPSSISLSRISAVYPSKKIQLYLFFQFDNGAATAYADWKTLSPESSQYSQSQVRVKEEGCVRFWQTNIKNATLMDLKPTRNSLGRNPLSDALHRNTGAS